jgi:predicted nucleic acid-binding protein
MYTLGTNILVYAADEEYPLHEPAKRLRNRASREAVRASLCLPVLLEFFAIITDPKRTRNPLSPDDAWQEVETYLRAFRILYPTSGVIARLGELVQRYQISRQGIFDALIVAIMLDNGVEGIYTANEDDFRRFREIKVLEWRA